MRCTKRSYVPSQQPCVAAPAIHRRPRNGPESTRSTASRGMRRRGRRIARPRSDIAENHRTWLRWRPVTRRLAIVASHVIQYQDPFFRALAADPEIDVTVFYCSRAGAEVYRDADMQTSLRWDIELLQGYRHVFLRNFGRGDGY